MKKKLTIEALKVQSFVTSADDTKNVKGGATFDIRCAGQQSYTCYDWISCERLMCVVASQAKPCVQDTTRPLID
jgi:hypothetical protein